MHFICCENTFISNLIMMKLISICCSSLDQILIVQPLELCNIFVLKQIASIFLYSIVWQLSNSRNIVIACKMVIIQCHSSFLQICRNFSLTLPSILCAKKDKRKQQHARVKLAYFIVNTDGQRPVVKLRIGQKRQK